MKITPLAALLFLSPLAASCKLKVTSTPVFPPLARPEEIDTVILLRPTDQFPPPDGLYLTSKMKMTNCFFTGTYDSLLRRIQKQAREKGGNVAQITEAGMYVTTVNVYSLDAEQLKDYHKLLDSLKDAYKESIKNIAVVYLVDQYQNSGTILFNDSLVARMRGVGLGALRDPPKTTLSFDKAGVLDIGGAGKIDIRPGQEYYILLYDGLQHRQFVHHYRLIDRDRFVITGIQLF